MKQKKLVLYFVFIVLISLIPLPVLNTFVLFTANTLEIQKLTKKQLFTTDNIESYANYIFYKKFKKSLNKPQVIVGKDDFLFLGNNYENIIDKIQGRYPYKIEDIQAWIQKLKDIQTSYEKQGIKFIIVIAPNKHFTYKDKLPDWANIDTNTITDDIVKLSLEKNINMLDLRDVFYKADKSTPLYLTTDTHWNNKGAAIAYENTIKFMNSTYKTNYITPKYTLSEVHGGSGDLASFLKINYLLPKDMETNYNFIFENDYEVCHGEIDMNSKLQPCKNKNNPRLDSINSHYVTSKNALNNNSLLLLCDSFGTANSKLYHATFNTIWRFHFKHLRSDKREEFINIHKPDVIIYQVIERSLYNQNIII